MIHMWTALCCLQTGATRKQFVLATEKTAQRHTLLWDLAEGPNTTHLAAAAANTILPHLTSLRKHSAKPRTANLLGQ